MHRQRTVQPETIRFKKMVISFFFYIFVIDLCSLKPYQVFMAEFHVTMTSVNLNQRYILGSFVEGITGTGLFSIDGNAFFMILYSSYSMTAPDSSKFNESSIIIISNGLNENEHLKRQRRYSICKNYIYIYGMLNCGTLPCFISVTRMTGKKIMLNF